MDTLLSNPYVPPKDGRCYINQLPPELLAHIFMLGHAQEDDEDEDEDSVPDIMDVDNDDGASDSDSDTDSDTPEPDFEVLVSHVCRHWREVATETPALWAFVDFSEGAPYTKSKTYLERSKNSPLVISIDCAYDASSDSDAPGVNVREVLPLVLPHVARWRVFEFMVSTYESMQLVLTACAQVSSAPMLETLQLYHYDDNEPSATFAPAALKEQDFVLFGNNTPMLRVVALWGVHLNWTRTTFLKGLTELNLAFHAEDVRPTWRQFVQMLTDSPALMSLELMQSGPAGSPTEWLVPDAEAEGPDALPPPPSSISLPELVNLELAYFPAAYVTALVDHIVMPQLSGLSLDLEEDDFSEFAMKLATRAAPGARPLLAGINSLKLVDFPCNQTAAVAVLSALQQACALNLNFERLGEKWFLGLITPPLVCPRLEALTSTGLDGLRVRKIVEVRKANGCPLKRVLVNQEDDMADDMEDHAAWLADNLEMFGTFVASDEEDDDEFDEDDIMVHSEDDDEEDGEQWTDEE